MPYYRCFRSKPLLYFLAAVLACTWLLLAGAVPPAQAATGTITGSVVNIRGGPGTGYAKVGSITRGAQVEVVKQSGDWCQIRFSGSRTGWVAGSLIQVKSTPAQVNKPQPSRAAPTDQSRAVQVTGTLVNLRQGAGTSYPTVGQVRQGTILTVISTQGDWYHVVGPDTPDGYIASWLVKSLGSTSPAPAAPQPTAPKPAPSNGIKNATVTGSAVNIRSGPGTSYSRVGQVVQGDKVQILKNSDQWCQVKTAQGKQGWMAGWLLAVVPNTQTPAPVQPADPGTTPPSTTPEPSNPSRGGERVGDPQPEPPTPPPPVEVVEGDLLEISELVAGNIQIISIKTSVKVAYAGEKGDNAYTLTLRGIHKGAQGSSISLNGKGASQIQLEEKIAPEIATTLTFNVLAPCIYGLTPAEEGKVLKLYIKADLSEQRTGTARVVLDPGHGGRDPGAIGPFGTYEKDINLPIAQEAGRLLSLDNIQVVYTRNSDVYVSLPERSQIANAADADIFVSIHCNGSTDASKDGTTTYYYAPAANPLLASQTGERSKLARSLQSALMQELGRADKGVRQDNFAVLRETTIPCALVETLFLTNPTEEQLLLRPAIQQQAAQAIARGIKDYLASAGRL